GLGHGLHQRGQLRVVGGCGGHRVLGHPVEAAGAVLGHVGAGRAERLVAHRGPGLLRALFRRGRGPGAAGLLGAARAGVGLPSHVPAPGQAEGEQGGGGQGGELGCVHGPCSFVFTGFFRSFAAVGGHSAITWTECRPEAPSGTGSARSAVCTAPVPSVTRTRRVCRPGERPTSARHWRQVSIPGTSASPASVQPPPSTDTSTAATPRCWAQATPATVAGPAPSRSSGPGTSIRDMVLTGARTAHPRSAQ